MTERRKSILAAAVRAFDASGYAATTMESVAAEAGISKGNIYNYFTSKHDLFQQVFGAAVATVESDAVRLLEQPVPATQKLDKLLDYWYQRLGYHKRIGRLVLEFWATAAREHQGEVADTFRQLYARWRARMAAVLAQGAQQGEFGREFNSPLAASLILAILDGIEIQSILEVGIDVNDEFLAALKRSIFATLAAKDGPTAADSRGVAS
jgi:AcrR family transcriptional regulator